MLIEFKTQYVWVVLLSVLIVLAARIIVVYLPVLLFPKFTKIGSKEAKLIVWGGLRGGLSIALVLSLPSGESKELLMLATYTCVVFSILIQGLTIERLARKLFKAEK